jgi:hypothetical protein
MVAGQTMCLLGNRKSHIKCLVPSYLDAIPTDPFDGHAIRLAIKGDRWIIYSVGPDGVDNGGAELVDEKGDITFILKAQ